MNEKNAAAKNSKDAGAKKVSPSPEADEKSAKDRAAKITIKLVNAVNNELKKPSVQIAEHLGSLIHDENLPGDV